MGEPRRRLQLPGILVLSTIVLTGLSACGDDESSSPLTTTAVEPTDAPEVTEAADTTDSTCKNWTSNGAGAASVGHHDRQGGGTNPTSWNNAHPSRGCSQENLKASGGAGMFYCFAI